MSPTRPRGIPLLLVALALGVPGQDPLEAAHEAAGRLLRDRLAATDARAHAFLRRCPDRRVLLVDGRYDHSDRVLRAVGIRFRRCSPQAFARTSLRGVRLLVIDCPGALGRGSAQRVRAFVAGGGTLLSTDWALEGVLERAFPGRVRYTRRPAGDDVVRITEVARHSLTRGVFPPDRPARWWIEDGSHPIDLVDPEVRVLFRAHGMGTRWGSPVIGVTFGHGRGTVVHLVSHLYAQRNVRLEAWERRDLADEIERLGFSPDSAAWRALREEGKDRSIRSGDLIAAASVQQLVINVFLHAHGRQPPRPPPVPRPPRPVPVPQVPWRAAARAAHLRDAPGGSWSLHVAEGLRLRVLERRGEWVRVATPAGQEGWLPEDALR